MKNKLNKLFIGFLFLGSANMALAFNAYHLYNKDGTDHWAIECADGTLHSYAGSSAGLDIVGPALCEGHGGLAGGSGDDIELKPMKECKEDSGGRPGRLRPGR